MPIKYKNNEGLNELKSNQSTHGLRDDYDPDDLKEEHFEVKDQEKVEQGAGEGGYTSGESFDKYPADDSEEELKTNSIGKAMKKHEQEESNHETQTQRE